MVQLDQHPSARDRLIQEMTPLPSAQFSSLEGVRQLSWTRACFEESLRLYPPIYCVPRLSTQEDTLLDYTIEPHTFLDCSLYLVQRNPAFWPDADTFNPERFMPDSPIPASRNAYMPFGHGQHHCMGGTMAMLQGPLMLANIYRHFSIALAQPVSRQQCIPKMLLQPARPMLAQFIQR